MSFDNQPDVLKYALGSHGNLKNLYLSAQADVARLTAELNAMTSERNLIRDDRDELLRQRIALVKELKSERDGGVR